MTQKTALFDLHLAATAKMVDFYGWNMPLNYGSQLQEHVAVRNNCGAFDISHMTFLDLQGKNCKSFLRTLLANDISNLEDDGDGMYSAMLNESGGVIDDLIIYKMPFGYRLIVNCATRKKDIKWISNHIDDSSVVMLERKDISMLAIQGPKYNEVISHCLPSSLLTELENKNTFQGVLEGDLFVSKTGYTGELGVEVMLPSKNVEEIWNSVIKNGASPVGLGARDTLRLEAGLNLYGSEMDESISPLECNMQWTVSLNDVDRNFIGKESYLKKAKENQNLNLFGLVVEERAILRSKEIVYLEEDAAVSGTVTSGSYSPTLKKSIALVRMPSTNSKFCFAELRGKKIYAKIGIPRFVKEGRIIFKGQ